MRVSDARDISLSAAQTSPRPPTPTTSTIRARIGNRSRSTSGTVALRPWLLFGCTDVAIRIAIWGSRIAEAASGPYLARHSNLRVSSLGFGILALRLILVLHESSELTSHSHRPRLLHPRAAPASVPRRVLASPHHGSAGASTGLGKTARPQRHACPACFGDAFSPRGRASWGRARDGQGRCRHSYGL